MSVLDANGLGDWLADRLVEIGDTLARRPAAAHRRCPAIRSSTSGCASRTCRSSRRRVTVTNPVTGATKDVKVTLFRKAGEIAGTRRGISEIVKWVNYVTDNRFLTIAADLSESINLEHGSLWGHYDPETNPAGTRIKAAIQEAGNVSTAIGLVSQSASVDPEKFAGRVGDQRHLRRVHAADVHAGARLEPAEPGQQVPDGRAAHPGRPLGPGDGGRRPHPLRHLRAAGVEAVPARPDDSPELLGLQRRGARPTSRRPRSPRASRRSASSRWRWRGPTSRWPIAAPSPTPTSAPPPRAST